ncbi:MAG: flagellar protein FliT [Candidimonas sp.]|nr:MAG: flagellar protein FliT [Candidimonas sp.]
MTDIRETDVVTNSMNTASTDNGRDTVSLYQGILDAVCRMHERALRADWLGVECCAHDYEASVRRLREQGPADTRPESVRRRCRAILLEILSHDAAVRDLVGPAQARLGDLIASATQQRKLMKSYGAHGAILPGSCSWV